MAIHPLDIAADQIVRWLQDAQRIGRPDLSVRASRSYVAGGISASERDAARLGEEEIEDLNQACGIGELEVAPLPPGGGWLLRVRAEDPLGSRLPEDHAPEEVPEELTLAAFQRLFIEPGRAAFFVSVEAETPEDQDRFRRLLEVIRTDRHPG